MSNDRAFLPHRQPSGGTDEELATNVYYRDNLDILRRYPPAAAVD